jgi:hypothetical protein
MADRRTRRHHGPVEILLWWVPPAVVTVIAMVWVSWLGRARSVGPDRSDAAQERFAAAIMRDLPSEVTRQVSAPRPMRERSTGIAVRPSQKPQKPAPTPVEPRPDADDRRTA